MRTHIATAAAAFVGVAPLASATVLLSENFANYTNGNLVGQNGWVQLGAFAGDPIQVVNGRVVIPGIPAGGTLIDNQDAYKNIASETLTVPSTLYLGLAITVNSAAPSTLTSPPYTFGITTAANGQSFVNWRFTFRSIGEGFQFGARVTGQTGSPFNYGSELAFGQQYLLVAKLEATASASDLISVYINPTTPDLSGDTPNFTSSIGTGTPPTGFGSFLFSQYSTSAAGQPSWSVSQVAIGTTAASVIGEFQQTPDFILGDFNFDGGLDGSDVDPFVLALSDLDTYLADFADAFADAYPGLTLDSSVVDIIGDFNGDSGFDGSDVDGFVAALSGGRPGIAAIPEPAALAPLTLAGVMLGRRRR